MLAGLRTLTPYLTFAGDVRFAYLAAGRGGQRRRPGDARPGQAGRRRRRGRAGRLDAHRHGDGLHRRQLAALPRRRVLHDGAGDQRRRREALRVVARDRGRASRRTANGVPWGYLGSVNDVFKSPQADSDQSMAIAHPSVADGRVHVHVDPRGEPLPRPRAPARLDRRDPERRRLAALLRRLHVGVQLDGGADDVLAHRAHLLDPRPGEHRPRPRGLLPEVDGRGARRRRRGVRLARRHARSALLPADGRAAARSRRSTTSKQAETQFARFDFVKATFAAQKAWRAAAAYRDLALGLAPGTSELEKGTKKEGASACPSAQG